MGHVPVGNIIREVQVVCKETGRHASRAESLVYVSYLTGTPPIHTEPDISIDLALLRDICVI